MPMVNSNMGRMRMKINTEQEQSELEMQPVMDCISEIQSLLEEMQSSGDVSKAQEIMVKMGKVMGMMSEMIGVKEPEVNKDEYMDMSTEDKDKVDAKEVLGE